jgi:PhnB protein
MAAVAPYLNFNGNTEEAFDFYKSVFGGEFNMVMRFKDVPAEHQMGEGNGDKIMHMSLPLDQGTILMGSDVPEMYDRAIIGTNISISINTESEEEANKIFNGLSAGGQAIMPMEKAFWGSYFGMLKDKFEINWMVSYEYSQQQS